MVPTSRRRMTSSTRRLRRTPIDSCRCCRRSHASGSWTSAREPAWRRSWRRSTPVTPGPWTSPRGPRAWRSLTGCSTAWRTSPSARATSTNRLVDLSLRQDRGPSSLRSGGHAQGGFPGCRLGGRGDHARDRARSAGALVARGKLYCLALGADRQGEPFESRIRGWLDEHESAFDVLLGVVETHTPEQIASQPLLRGEIGYQEFKARKEAFEKAGVERFVYGLIVVQRVPDAERPPFTARRQLGPRTGSAEFEWALRWESAAASPAFLLQARPVISKNLELRVIHRVEQGTLAPADYTLLTDYPFSMECQVHLWTAALTEVCDGKQDRLRDPRTLPPERLDFPRRRRGGLRPLPRLAGLRRISWRSRVHSLFNISGPDEYARMRDVLRRADYHEKGLIERARPDPIAGARRARSAAFPPRDAGVAASRRRDPPLRHRGSGGGCGGRGGRWRRCPWRTGCGRG